MVIDHDTGNLFVKYNLKYSLKFLDAKMFMTANENELVFGTDDVISERYDYALSLVSTAA